MPCMSSQLQLRVLQILVWCWSVCAEFDAVSISLLLCDFHEHALGVHIYGQSPTHAHAHLSWVVKAHVS